MRVCNAANPTQIKNRFLFRAVSVTVGDISSISAFTFSFAIATDFCIAEAVQCFHSGDLVKIELILVVEQETPPLYLWKAPNRLIERFIPFFLNHAFIKALRHTQRPSVKGFVPYLVKLPVPLVPLEKIPVPALHLPKLHKELFRHFQLVGFALPVLKADKIPCAAFRGFLPKRVCLNPVCHPVVLLQKMSEGISIPHPSSPQDGRLF